MPPRAIRCTARRSARRWRRLCTSRSRGWRTAPDEWPAALAGLKARGFTIVAFTPAGAGRDLDEFAASLRPARLALLFGSEGPGLSAASEAAADHRVRIPISSRVDSLNLAVAAGIALHRLSQGRQGGLGRARLGHTG